MVLLQTHTPWRLLLHTSSARLTPPPLPFVQDWGSNDCAWDWGDAISGSINATVGKDIDAGAGFDADIQIKASIIPVNLKFSCALCGATCEVTVLGQTISVDLPDC